MKNSDRGSSFFFILLSVGICTASLQLQRGTIWYSGPMIFPLLLGLTLLGLSITLFIQSGGASSSISSALFQKGEGGKALYLLGVFFLTVLLFETIGFVLSIFLLMVLLIRGMGQRSLKVGFFYGLTISVSTYFFFTRLLGALLPRGILWFF